MRIKNSKVLFGTNGNIFIFPIGIFLILFFVTVALSYFVFKNIEENSQKIFKIANKDLIILIEDTLDEYLSILFSVRGLYAASMFVDRSEFSIFVNSQDLFERFPGLQAIEFLNHVNDENINDFIKSVVNDTSYNDKGYPNFSISPSGKRDEYYIVNYIEPLAGNEVAFGFDVFSNSTRREAIEKSRDTNSVIITSPIVLVQGGKDESVVLASLPIYKNGFPKDTVEQRREAINGVVLAIFRIQDLFNDIMKESRGATKNIHYRIEDINVSDESKLLLDSQVYFNGDYSDHKRKYLVKTTIEVGGRSWEIISSETPEFTDNIKSKFIFWIVLLIGTLLSVTVSYIIFVYADSRQKAVDLANTMTRDLRIARENAENALVIEESSKQKVEQALRSAEESKAVVEKSLIEVEKSKKSFKRMNELMTGRELKMIELKKEIADLKKNK